MAESEQIREEPVCTLWQRMLEGVLGVCLLFGIALMVRFYPAAKPPDLQQKDDLQRQVQQLGNKVDQLEQEQAMPALVLNRYRNSICYIFGIYQVRFPHHQPQSIPSRTSHAHAPRYRSAAIPVARSRGPACRDSPSLGHSPERARHREPTRARGADPSSISPRQSVSRTW